MGFNPNPNQEEVINYGKGTLLVEAGPGSGKTTVIVEKINELITSHKTIVFDTSKIDIQQIISFKLNVPNKF